MKFLKLNFLNVEGNLFIDCEGVFESLSVYDSFEELIIFGKSSNLHLYF